MDITLTEKRSTLSIDGVKITIEKITSNQVKIGIQAHESIKIVRKELISNHLSYLDDRVQKFKSYRI